MNAQMIRPATAVSSAAEGGAARSRSPRVLPHGQASDGADYLDLALRPLGFAVARGVNALHLERVLAGLHLLELHRRGAGAPLALVQLAAEGRAVATGGVGEAEDERALAGLRSRAHRDPGLRSDRVLCVGRGVGAGGLIAGWIHSDRVEVGGLVLRPPDDDARLE